MAAVWTNWFNAAFAARYEYHPPKPLSPIDPTRAASTASLASRPFGISRTACLTTKAGPIAFSANCASIAAGSKARRVFSGRAPSISSAPVVTKIRSNSPERPPSTRATEASSVTSKPSPDRDRPTTSPRSANRATKAAPIPPVAPITKDRITPLQLPTRVNPKPSSAQPLRKNSPAGGPPPPPQPAAAEPDRDSGGCGPLYGGQARPTFSQLPPSLHEIPPYSPTS